MSRIQDALNKAASRRKSPIESAAEITLSATQKEKRIPEPELLKKEASPLLDISPIKVNNLMLATARDEKTEVVEEYNKLRSTIVALTKGEKLLNTLMITSTVSEEGKSMTALNLAISLAKEHNYTVLLVDTDLRRPSMHRFLGIKPEVGLVDCLRDNLPIEKALIKTGIGKLVVLPAGEAVNDPVDMLGSKRMKEIIRELRERYDDRYIIFDTPPASPFADAKVLAANMDATLYIVREGKAPLEAMAKTLESFKEHNLLGVVYNDAHTFMKKQDYYYY